MKQFIILGALALSLPIFAAQDTNYQYKDISSSQARPLGNSSDTTKEEHIRKQLDVAREEVQKQEAELEEDKAEVERLEEQLDAKED